MKLSKVENLENPVEDSESMEENENIQLDVDMGDTPIVPKAKRVKTEKQIEAWNKALKAREENRLKRKAEKEQQQEEHKKDLENKIIVKAKRIKKSQEKVLGNLDELKDDAGTKFPKRTIKRKQIIVYENDDTDDDSDSDYVEEKVVVKNKPKNKKQVASVPLPPIVEPVKPVYKHVITFV